MHESTIATTAPPEHLASGEALVVQGEGLEVDERVRDIIAKSDLTTLGKTVVIHRYTGEQAPVYDDGSLHVHLFGSCFGREVINENFNDPGSSGRQYLTCKALSRIFSGRLVFDRHGQNPLGEVQGNNLYVRFDTDPSSEAAMRLLGETLRLAFLWHFASPSVQEKIFRNLTDQHYEATVRAFCHALSKGISLETSLRQEITSKYDVLWRSLGYEWRRLKSIARESKLNPEDTKEAQRLATEIQGLLANISDLEKQLATCLCEAESRLDPNIERARRELEALRSDPSVLGFRAENQQLTVYTRTLHARLRGPTERWTKRWELGMFTLSFNLSRDERSYDFYAYNMTRRTDKGDSTPLISAGGTKCIGSWANLFSQQKTLRGAYVIRTAFIQEVDPGTQHQAFKSFPEVFEKGE